MLHTCFANIEASSKLSSLNILDFRRIVSFKFIVEVRLGYFES